MIKPTFYNLPPEKRAKIIDVTKKEFSKGNKKKITINNVIEKAGISRGSFYQYFDDKLDLVAIVVDDMLNKFSAFLQDELIFNGGNIFLIPVKIFDIMMAQKSDFSDILIINPQDNQNSELIDDYMQYRYHHKKPFESLLKYIDKNKFKDVSDENIICIVGMLLDLIRTAIFNVKNGINSVDKERAFLIKKIEIIKNGALIK